MPKKIPLRKLPANPETGFGLRVTYGPCQYDGKFLNWVRWYETAADRKEGMKRLRKRREKDGAKFTVEIINGSLSNPR